jgi:hypothetical protein
MFLLIDQLSESQLFPSRKSLGIAYLHIVALNILVSEEYTRWWAQNYAKKTTRANNFKKWRNDATDLYVAIHALTDHEETLSDETRADYYRDGVGIYPFLIFNWILKAGILNNLKETDTKRLFCKLDQIFRINNSLLRSVRRFSENWDDIPITDKKLAMTRLIQFMRNKCPKSDLLPQLIKLAGVNQWTDPEGARKPKHSFLTSLVAAGAGGLIGAALTRKLRHESAGDYIKKQAKKLALKRSYNNCRKGEPDMRIHEILEASSGGGTGASSVAAVAGNGKSAAGTIGAGFDLDYTKSVYPSPAPKKEKKKAVLSRLTETKAHYVGNCVDSFDEDGDCITPFLPWGTVSDFAVAEENAKQIDEKEFLEHVDKVHNIRAAKYYVTSDGVYMQYDPRKDVHYFYIET